MNANQRSEGNNQSNNGGNELDVSSSRAGSTAGKAKTDRAQQAGTPGERESNDLAGGMPRSPGGNRQAADQKMDDDTGLSNTANREPSEPDQNKRQERQSNVGRRDDGTPD
jgi:hypothetical protein